MGGVLEIHIKQADAVNLIGGLVQVDGISRLIGRGQRVAGGLGEAVRDSVLNLLPFPV